MIISAWVLISVAGVLLWISRRMQQSTGLPSGRVIYSDSRGWQPVDAPFFDSRLGLVGRPDYLVQTGEDIVPVEVKSGRTPREPYENHVYQLAAYCLLIHRTGTSRPAFGLLHYRQKNFKVDFSHELETAVLNLITQMRSEIENGNSDRSHEITQRCRSCGYRPTCDQKLS